MLSLLIKPYIKWLMLSPLLFCLSISFSHAEDTSTQEKFESEVDQLSEPLYTPFIERYVLDELKSLREQMAMQKHEMIQQIVDRQIKTNDDVMSYATDTVTYFFYLIAGVSSVLVIVGWTSVREIKEKVQGIAHEQITTIVKEYEDRLVDFEKQLSQKTKHIEYNRVEIERTQDIQSLWMRAAQENDHYGKIEIYDEILKIKPDELEALTYKADSALVLNEPKWANNLCDQAIKMDEKCAHAWYQKACAQTQMEQFESAVSSLKTALELNPSLDLHINEDEEMVILKAQPVYKLAFETLDPNA